MPSNFYIIITFALLLQLASFRKYIKSIGVSELDFREVIKYILLITTDCGQRSASLNNFGPYIINGERAYLERSLGMPTSCSVLFPHRSITYAEGHWSTIDGSSQPTHCLNDAKALGLKYVNLVSLLRWLICTCILLVGYTIFYFSMLFTLHFNLLLPSVHLFCSSVHLFNSVLFDVYHSLSEWADILE